ncbi:ARM repeat superfamily protein [Artemisia annua]|uniref:ARM repeat superfamily protein n=1 Tax=Artemisia annua TaxID=35608 RepID=A0A2U1KI45_ARTAN|nr:ARM repeat superfamily protein [Artemisia annua]
MSGLKVKALQSNTPIKIHSQALALEEKMVQHKAQLKKQQKKQRGGVDFKKIKRKIGRKLPPPKNATNTQVKSKAIVLPEQSLASDKAGLAVSKKGLTLKELLTQTSHHNAKVRRDALIGIRDIFLKHPAELKMHRLSVIEKLRERMGDEDKIVRETLYQLLKAVIFPECKEGGKNGSLEVWRALFVYMVHNA